MNDKNTKNSENNNNNYHYPKDVLITAMLFIFLPSIIFAISKKFQINSFILFGTVIIFIYFLKKLIFIFNNKINMFHKTKFETNINTNIQTDIQDDIPIFLKKEKNNIYNSASFTNNCIKTSMNNSLISNDRDDYFVEAGKLVITKNKASVGAIQRTFKIGFNRAYRIMEQLYDSGVVGPEIDFKPREVLMSMEEFNYICSQSMIKNSFYHSENKNAITNNIENIMNIDSIQLKNKDEFFIDAGKLFITNSYGSANMLQTYYNISFNHAKKIIKELCAVGVISDKCKDGRMEVLVNLSDFSIICYNLYLLEIDNCANDLTYYKTKQLNDININYDLMSGLEFEHFCAELLEKNGFYKVEVTKGSSDHGIDILAEKDDITYAIQCKCYSSNVGNSAVQQAHTGKTLYHKDIAVVLTNCYFTKQAIDEAQILSVKLWDRDKLNQMIEK